MRKSARFLLTLLVPSLLSVHCLIAASLTGTTGGQVLEVSPDARAAAMGGAYCAVSDDAGCLYYNPAGLGGIDHIEIPLTNNQLFQGMTQQHAGIIYSLRDVRSSNVLGMGTIAGDISFFDAGSMVKRDAAGASLGSFTHKAVLATAAYGRRLYEAENSWQVFGGVSARMLSEESDNEKANNMSFDAGTLVTTPLKTLSFGFTVQNIGGKMNYVSEKNDLPLNIKTGTALRLFDNSFLIAMDLNRPFYGKNWMAFGTEYIVQETLAFRVGYSTLSDQGSGLSTGIGLKISNLDFDFMYARELDIDYAFVPSGELGNLHRITLVFKLGAD